MNVFKAISTWTISVVRYSAAFLRWLLDEIDKRMHNEFYPKSNVNPLCISRREGGTGFIGVQDIVETEILWFRN